MSETPAPAPKTPLEQLLEAIPTLIVSGSGGYGLYCLFTDDLPKALLGALIAAATTPFTSAWQGFTTRLSEKSKARGEQLADKTDQLLDRPLESLTSFEQRYRQVMRTHCYALEMEGIDDLSSLALEQVFVPLKVESQRTGRQEIWDFLPSPKQPPSAYPHRRIVILAGPGYGKSTLLRYLTLRYTTSPLPDSTPAFIPLLLRLRDIHPLITDDDPPSLPILITQHLGKQGEFRNCPPSQDWFQKQLRQGRCLVMLDGLDEVPQARRNAIRTWADREMRAYPSQFILTSRPGGYRSQPDAPAAPLQVDQTLEILDFNPDQAQQFIEKWCEAVAREKWDSLQRQSHRQGQPLSNEEVELGVAKDATASARDLVAQVFANRALTDLAKNPLLVTMIAKTYRSQTQLAERRVDLYQAILDLLLGTRPHHKRTPLTLPASGNLLVLQTLAWNLMQQAQKTNQFTPQQGEAWIQSILASCCRDQSLSPGQFLEEIRKIAGLLVEKEAEFYEFSHQTFQEYLVARYLKELETGQQSILANLGNDRWEEVVCFYAALGDATPLIQAVLAAPNPSPQVLKVAQRCRREGRRLDPAVRNQLDALLAQTQTVSAPLRLEQRFRDLIPLADQTHITAHPITWGEYGLFLADQATGQFHSWAEVVTITPDQDHQPVTGLNPEDARWFCAWLSTQTQLQPEQGVYDYRPAIPQEEVVGTRQCRVPTGGGVNSEAPPPHRPALSSNDSRTGGGASRRHSLAEPGNEKHLWIVRTQIPDRYGPLVSYLAAGRWREADQTTNQVMLEVADRQSQGYLDRASIEQFPCPDLRIIDQLWVKFSGGRFGFSVQKQIYVSVGAKLDGRYPGDEIWRTFGTAVGWRVNDQWLEYDRFFEDSSLTQGILPCVEICGECLDPYRSFDLCLGVCWLFSRAQTCEV